MDASLESSLTGTRLLPEYTEAAYERAPEWCPWLFASAPRLLAIVDEVVRQALNAERVLRRFKRTRARRPRDLRTFRETIEALVAHAAYEAVRGAGPVSVSLARDVLNRSTRYLSQLQSKQLPHILRLLSATDLAFLTMRLGTPAGYRIVEGEMVVTEGRLTRFAAGLSLVSRLTDVGITVDDVDRKPGEEIVMLKSTKDEDTGLASLVDYPDNELADGYRVEVAKINAHLKGADIEYTGGVAYVDDQKRHLVRRFTRSAWGCGGRLWNGFWLSLTKADRLTNLRINGDRVAEVDFQSMVLSLAYAYVGAAIPDGDLYEAVTFVGTSGTPVTIPRDDVKTLVAARLNGAKEWPEDLRKYRSGLPWTRAVAAIKAAHPAIADLFDRGDIGQVLAFTESEVLVDALLRLIDHDVVALPIHDCVVVAEEDVAIAERAMLESFHLHTKQHGRVTIKRAP